VPVLEMPMHGFLSLDSPRDLRLMGRYVRRHGIRLVHTFDYPMNVFGIPAARLLRVPVVLASQRSYRSLIPPKYHGMLRLSDRLANGIVVNCEAIRRHLVEDYCVPERKIQVWHNALDTTQFHPAPRQRPPELRDASLVIGSVSVLRAPKGLPVLLEAFARVRPSQPGLRLVLVGSGPDREALARQSRDLGIHDACLFRPSVPDVVPWLRAIDLFVLPSISEAFSNSLMEAMACGCCPIASRVGGNPELIRHGETGLLFESRDSADLAAQLLAAIQNAPLRETLARNAAAWVAEQFALPRSIGRIQQIYEHFLAAGH